MNEQKQRIAIAEACGWTEWTKDTPNCLSPEERHEGMMICPSGYGAARPPDYLNDLNAMRSAEITLTLNKRYDYIKEINKVAAGVYRKSKPWIKVSAPEFATEVTVYSTAAQRAEAFLRTIGKWEE